MSPIEEQLVPMKRAKESLHPPIMTPSVKQVPQTPNNAIPSTPMVTVVIVIVVMLLYPIKFPIKDKTKVKQTSSKNCDR